MRRLHPALPVLLLSLVLPSALAATGAYPQEDDRKAVEAAVRDYVEGIYTVAPERIERSVHPSLTKRGIHRPDDAEEYSEVMTMTYDQLVELAGKWNVDDRQGSDLTYEIEVDQLLDRTASAFLSADWGVAHMQLLKIDGEWKILQILWQRHPPEQ